MRDDRILTALDEVVELITARDGRSDAVTEAALACAEAARAAWRLRDDRPEAFDKAGQEALEAMRAAVLAVRFALVERGDARRDAA